MVDKRSPTIGSIRKVSRVSEPHPHKSSGLVQDRRQEIIRLTVDMLQFCFSLVKERFYSSLMQPIARSFSLDLFALDEMFIRSIFLFLCFFCRLLKRSLVYL